HREALADEASDPRRQLRRLLTRESLEGMASAEGVDERGRPITGPDDPPPRRVSFRRRRAHEHRAGSGCLLRRALRQPEFGEQPPGRIVRIRAIHAIETERACHGPIADTDGLERESDLSGERSDHDARPASRRRASRSPARGSGFRAAFGPDAFGEVRTDAGLGDRARVPVHDAVVGLAERPLDGARVLDRDGIDAWVVVEIGALARDRDGERRVAIEKALDERNDADDLVALTTGDVVHREERERSASQCGRGGWSQWKAGGQPAVEARTDFPPRSRAFREAGRDVAKARPSTEGPDEAIDDG